MEKEETNSRCNDTSDSSESPQLSNDTTNDLPPLSSHLVENRQQIEHIFIDCSDLILLPWRYGPDLSEQAFSVYFDTMIQQHHTNYVKETLQDLVNHRVGTGESVTPEQIIRFFQNHGVSSGTAELLKDFDEVTRHITEGCLVIFFDKWNQALSYKAAEVEKRQVSEPINEPVVQGPHITLIEDINTNIGILRHLLQSPKLKFISFNAGRESNRTVSYGYLEGAVNPEVLTNFQSRIKSIKEEEILEVSYLEDWIGDSVYSPFPQVRYTERPDNTAAALLDGKIIVMVDGSPTVLICPGNFYEFLMSSEDYYQRTIFSSLIRLLRIGAFFIALMLPSTYVALSTFHSELIPTVLLLAILDTREGIPFPAFMEALIMEIFFELLREAGIRLPRPIGSAVSIVGALVIGQAAIQAKIASPVMVIVVALTGIASFALPQYSMAIALRIMRFPLMVMGATLGGVGIMIGFLLALLHLCKLRSLGQPYMAPTTPLDIWQLRDVLVMVPRKFLLRRPRNRHMHRVIRKQAK
ncbi:spore germination protein [Paenibacillus sp. GCM10012307]|uniref:Spore germination protein n=1 Tax=Paenibacillus roseus TaxID=2798579 RepID=A0A934J4E1_9BACL|nr:spore germination protein [Paenibacillus roseus]MBJ6361459.1 spore germination protein [Paenibacillus roseus]